jgi:hypothetical protein
MLYYRRNREVEMNLEVEGGRYNKNFWRNE